MSLFGAQISGERVAGGELSVRQRDSIVFKHEAGISSLDLAAEFGCSKRTINRTIQRFKTTNTNESRRRSGQPPVLSCREKRYLFRLARQQPKIEYRQMQQELGWLFTDTNLPTVSTTTMRTALNQMGIHKFRAALRTKINAGTAAERLRYAREGSTFNWKRCTVKFSDECSVQRGSGRDTQWSFGCFDERYDKDKVTEVTTSRGKRQMVWAAIWVTPGGRVGRSPLVIIGRDESAPRRGYTSQSYQNALDHGLISFYKPGERFMQDNSGIHAAKKTIEYLERHGIWTIEHPPHSPDLNPIEHIWWALKRAIHQVHPEFDQMGNGQEEWDQFCTALQEVWWTIPDSMIRTLIYSMPRRLAAVERAYGYYTKC